MLFFVCCFLFFVCFDTSLFIFILFLFLLFVFTFAFAFAFAFVFVFVFVFVFASVFACAVSISLLLFPCFASLVLCFAVLSSCNLKSWIQPLTYVSRGRAFHSLGPWYMRDFWYLVVLVFLYFHEPFFILSGDHCTTRVLPASVVCVRGDAEHVLKDVFSSSVR